MKHQSLLGFFYYLGNNTHEMEFKFVVCIKWMPKCSCIQGVKC